LRFFGRRVAVAFAGYAHCPRCGNFALDRISKERVEKGTLVFLKRLLRFPAYRCDPCRERFFSSLPYRKIVPSMASSIDRTLRPEV
jgi:putative component of membrane protein insertase Oxa1/YidC/SpoIIIJ protein YidD